MFSLLDIILIVAVSGQCLLMAYLRRPFAKSLMLVIPVPVTFGILAVGRPIDITNVAGLLLSMGFTMAVLGLYSGLRAPILPTIVVSALAYGGGAAWLARFLPRTESVFWLGSAAVAAVAVGLVFAMPAKEEAPYRSPLPLWLKTLIILLVVTALVLAKKELQGFMTTFPMLGVVASYETRQSLYTTSRQIPISCLSFVVMFALCRLLQDSLGLHLALVPGVALYLGLVLWFNRRHLAAGGS